MKLTEYTAKLLLEQGCIIYLADKNWSIRAVSPGLYQWGWAVGAKIGTIGTGSWFEASIMASWEYSDWSLDWSNVFNASIQEVLKED